MVLSRLLFGTLLLLVLVSSSVRGLTTTRRKLLKTTVATTVASIAVQAKDASAYDRRDVGDPATRSAATAAMNDQAFKTNNRLEQQGFKLDTFEEEQARLSSAMASFSYDDATTKKKKKPASEKGSNAKK